MPAWMASVLQTLLDFSRVLNASIAASWMVLAVIALRFLLKRAPKWSHVALWGLVALRLLLPFSIESSFSLIPSAETVPQELLRCQGTELHNPAYLNIVSNPNNWGEFSVPVGKTVDSLQWDMVEMTPLWLAGMGVLVLYIAVSYWLLRRRVATAVRYRDNIFQSEHVDSPFVLGIFKPVIYLPFQMEGQSVEHVVAHEQAHIRRRDHWWKPLGFLLLTVHWFNPLLWYAYTLFCRDMELACDEKVIRELDHGRRADYAQALVSCSAHRRAVAACPLAFGEVGVKERVKAVMHYRKPSFWLIALAVAACAVAAVCFLTDPVEMTQAEDQYYLRIGASGVKEIQVSQPGSSGGVVNADGSLFRKGDRVWLEQLDGVADLRGVSITALDRNGKSVYLFSVPASASDEELAKLVNADDWLVAPKVPMKERPVDGEVLHLGLNAEIIGIDAEAQVLYVKDMDENAAVFGERCAIDCAKAIREHCLIYVNYSAEGDVRSIDFSDFRVGDAVIVDLYDGEKQQALKGSATAEQIQLSTQRMNQPDVVHYPAHKALYEPTPAEQIEETIENEEFVISRLHYETLDGKWACEGYTYRYRLEISGRLHNAAGNTAYIVLSNTREIGFDETWKASGISSDLADYFDPAVAVIVGSRFFS